VEEERDIILLEKGAGVGGGRPPSGGCGNSKKKKEVVKYSAKGIGPSKKKTNKLVRGKHLQKGWRKSEGAPDRRSKGVLCRAPVVAASPEERSVNECVVGKENRKLCDGKESAFV